MPRFLSFAIFTFLKITIVLMKNLHSTVMNACKTIEYLLQNNTPFLESEIKAKNKDISNERPHIQSNNQYFPVCAETEKHSLLSTGVKHGQSLNTGVFIYNLNSSKEVTITHKNLKTNRIRSILPDHCKNCRFESKLLLISDVTSENNQTSDADVNFSANQCDLNRSTQSSENSNMSLEEDESNTQIILNTPTNFSSTKCKSKIFLDRSTQLSVHQELHSDLGMKYDCEFKDCDETQYKNLQLFDINPHDRNEETSHPLKTSSPIDQGSKLTCVYPYSEIDKYQKIKQPNNMIQNDVIMNKVSNTFEESQISEKDYADNSTVTANTVSLDKSVGHLYSLSPSVMNSASNKTINLKHIQDEIIENALKGTPRHNKNLKEIKFPYSSAINDIKHIDDNEEFKEVFSSYESLPVSDHIRNAVENSALSLSWKKFENSSEPDFSSVYTLVDAFRKIENTLSVSEAVKNKIPNYFPSNKYNENEYERLDKTQNVESIVTHEKNNNESNSIKELSSAMLNNASINQTSQNDYYFDNFAAHQNSNLFFIPINRVEPTGFKFETSSLPSSPQSNVCMQKLKMSNCNYSDNKHCKKDIKSMNEEFTSCNNNDQLDVMNDFKCSVNQSSDYRLIPESAEKVQPKNIACNLKFNQFTENKNLYIHKKEEKVSEDLSIGNNCKIEIKENTAIDNLISNKNEHCTTNQKLYTGSQNIAESKERIVTNHQLTDAQIESVIFSDEGSSERNYCSSFEEEVEREFTEVDMSSISINSIDTVPSEENSINKSDDEENYFSTQINDIENKYKLTFIDEDEVEIHVTEENRNKFINKTEETSVEHEDENYLTKSTAGEETLLF